MLAATLHDVKRAAVKAKLLTHTYTLTSDKARFSKTSMSTCPLCRKDPETLEHFLLSCEILEETRLKHIKEIHRLLENKEWNDPKTRPTWLLQVIMDCHNSPECNENQLEDIKRFYITLEGVLFWPSYILFGYILTSFIGTKRFYSALMDYHIWTFKCTYMDHMDHIRRYEDGFYEDGFYEDGFYEDGFYEDGFYEDILKCA